MKIVKEKLSGNRTLGSSTLSRRSFRVYSAAQIANTGVGFFSQIATVPITFGQLLITFFSLIHQDTRLYERAIHLLQTLIVTAELALILLLFFEDDQCDDAKMLSDLCKTLAVIKLLKDGLLLSGLVPSELSKAPKRKLNEDNKENAGESKEGEAKSSADAEESEESDLEEAVVGSEDRSSLNP